MKKYVIVIFTCLISSCYWFSAGTLGGWDTIVFPVKEKDMDSYLKICYHQYPQFKVPVEKQYLEDTWKEPGYNELKGIFFYLKDEPMKLYYVTYIDAGYGANYPEYARIALRAVYKEGNDRWYIKDEMSDKEQHAIDEIFKKEIVSRLERVTKTQSYIRK